MRGFHHLRSIVADLPWDHIVVDWVTPVPVSDDGQKTLLVVVDIMTKYAILRCAVGKDMEQIAELYGRHCPYSMFPKLFNRMAVLSLLINFSRK